MHEERDLELGEMLERIPVPPPPATLLERSTRQAAGLAHWRLKLAIVTLVTGSLFGAIGVAAGALLAEPPAAPPERSEILTFRPAAGWNLVVTPLPEKLQDNNQIAWAANVPLAGGRAASGWSRDTVMTLGPGGVVVFASAARQVSDAASYDALDRLPTLDDGYFVADGYEMQPAPNVSVWMIECRCRGVYLTVQVWFGRNDPTDSDLEAARAELGRLVLPEM